MNRLSTYLLLFLLTLLAIFVRYDHSINGQYYEADGYYWKMLSHQPLPISVGEVTNYLRLAPEGVNESFNLHSLITHWLSTTGTYVYEVLMIILLVAALYKIGDFLLVSLVMFAPLIVARTAVGWNDTDIYVILFSSLALNSLVKGRYFTSSLLILVLSFFWCGWVYIAGLLGAAVLLFKPAEAKIRFFMGVSLCTCLWPQHIVDLLKVFQPSAWPSGLMTTAEMLTPSFTKVLWLVSPVYLALLFGSAFILIWKREYTLLLVSGVSIGMVFFGERFLLPAIPLCAIGIGVALQSLHLSKRFQTIIISLVIIITSACALNYMHLHKYLKIVDTGWTEGCTYLNQNTAKDAVIVTWWSAGHVITGVANRAVLIDGGTQHKPRIFWLARAMMTPDFQEMRTILIYLSHFGDRGINQLVDERLDYAKILDYMNDKIGALPTVRPVYLLLYKEMVLNYSSLKKIAEWFSQDYPSHKVPVLQGTGYFKLLAGIDKTNEPEYTYNDGKNMIKVWKVREGE